MLDRHDLRKISQPAHYDDTVDTFWEGTRDHDVSLNLDALLSHVGIGLSDPGPRLRAGPRSTHVPGPGARGGRLRWRRALHRHGTKPHRLRGMALGLPRTRTPRGALRRRVRECVVVPRPGAGATARPRRDSGHAPRARDPLQLEPPRAKSRGLARPALRHVPRRRGMASGEFGGLRRAGASLPTDWASASAAAVARDGLAQGLARRCQLLEWCMCDPRGVRRSERSVYNRFRCIV